MTTLKHIDGAEVHVLVDDVTDPLSSVPTLCRDRVCCSGTASRWRLGLKRELSVLRSARPLFSDHPAPRQCGQDPTLFDAGPEDRTFEQNVSRLAIDLGTVEAIVLSHGHCDHGGGGAMLRALQLIRDRNGGRKVPYYCHPDMF
jgi:7,8-dihydropterin-6-yl-methyl-4-(beta-D-ribofuranosyl)aminobenzene 5'-phosphate synthase